MSSNEYLEEEEVVKCECCGEVMEKEVPVLKVSFLHAPPHGYEAEDVNGDAWEYDLYEDEWKRVSDDELCENCREKEDEDGVECEECREKFDEERIVGCCNDGDCPHHIETLCNKCGTWDKDAQVWRCVSCSNA